jgi:hypothetical protein
MEQETEGRVRVVNQVKKISQYDAEGKAKYSKGYIVGDKVLPLEFVEGTLVEDDCPAFSEPEIQFDLE